ncbi:SIS domain-containing protein [Halocynthiibacter sp. C4]|uniref:SIS domain-containing protein n=1 Tax=Halocynthiibacter sp. C4 TaxID=2992758 RepID=UPI00237A1C3C|nr:SIS domain-containing protein [Halocynthiibacter sp. C4]MDE0589170.1 SIS domain-containing protein [Halocynthiibacter sp. C4]
MTTETLAAGAHMAKETAEARDVFCKTALQSAEVSALKGAKAIYTIARGSSDAAANILSYEFMRELRIPMTSLPPSVFSLGAGVGMDGNAVMVISQSGASDDLVLSTKGAIASGASVVALTNQPNSAVEAASDVTVPIGAGEELAVPATKTVIGSVAAGMSILSALLPDYAARTKASVEALQSAQTTHPRNSDLRAALLRAQSVYVIGRDTGFGAAVEVALKLKECCALHAEAYSSSEVLHGPLQLATNPLMVLLLDTGLETTQESLDQAEERFKAVGCDVHRIRPSDVGVSGVTPAAAAALLLNFMYTAIHETALALGLNPDTPSTLKKVTQTK